MDVGVYIHFPWCRKRCPYCDFAIAVAPLAEIPHVEYLRAILQELDSERGRFAGRNLVSIYLGGGTPSLWDPACLVEVIGAVRERFGVEPQAAAALEVTLEANPSDCTPGRLQTWGAAGINRLSIGVQSVDPDELVTLGRDHRFGDGELAVQAARAAGFGRLSCDAILGTPGRVRQAGQCDPSVARLAALDPGHLSIYELTIEARTEFGRQVARGQLRPLDDDILADEYAAVHRALTSAGYEHYEVSSYARPGHRAVHNSLYWRGGEYLGLGNGAASFWRAGSGAVRTSNLRSVRSYMNDPAGVAERIDISEAELAAELAWLGLRTSDGIALGQVSPGLADWLVGRGLATRDDHRILPTLNGFLHADRVAREVVADGR
jgi:oxygen-independent coproporphyrinogen III oxidase